MAQDGGTGHGIAYHGVARDDATRHGTVRHGTHPGTLGLGIEEGVVPLGEEILLAGDDDTGARRGRHNP
jgi:hypothetical protein